MIHKLPFAGGWTDERDMPAPAGQTFRDLYRARNAPADANQARRAA
jgi:L-lactate dehydrogenase complex protein LldF